MYFIAGLTCSDPDDLPHADFTPDTPGQNFEYGDSVTYICHYGKDFL